MRNNRLLEKFVVEYKNREIYNSLPIK